METDRELPAAFGDLVRRGRAATGLTQEELAERAGVSARSISDIERGVSRDPHKHTVSLLADALGLSGGARTAFEISARGRRLGRSVDFRFHAAPGPVLGASELVGRDDEIARVQRHLADAGPPMLMLAGEPGLGKTRLLDEAMRQAASRGWSVLEGGCQRRGTQEPFAPLVAALTMFLSRRPVAALREDLRGCAWLVRLLPELAGTIGEELPGWAVPPDQERRLIFAAVTRLLSNVARIRRSDSCAGVLLVLDDLQWAGSDALELLTAVVRSGGKGTTVADQRPLRVVGAYRDTEVEPDDQLGTALADWAHAKLVSHLALEPLAPEACGRLLDQLLVGVDSNDLTASGRAALRERVLQRAGGIPFFLVSYAQALQRGDVQGGADAVPWDVAQSVRQRVGALTKEARAILAMAAVVGRASQPALLATMAGGPEEGVLAGLEAACQARLLVDAGNIYAFAHDVVREVVESDIGSARLTSLHRGAAKAIEELHLERLADHYETLADHWQRGEVWDKALRYLALSGDKSVASGAIRQALHHYDQALAVCDRLGEKAQSEAVAIAEKRGFVCYDSGDFAGAVADFSRMGDVAARLRDRRREGLALAYRGMAAYYAHDFEAAEEALRSALAVANEGFDDVRLFASIQLGSLLMVTNRHAEAPPLIEAAEKLASRVDDPLSQSWWAITGSEVQHWSGRYAEALALLERWEPAVTASNQLVVFLWTRWEAALACGGKGEYTRALALLEQIMTACVTNDETFIQARALNTAGWIHGELQDHERALELNAQSLALAEAIETVDTEIGSNARLNLGDSYLALGRLDQAELHFQAVERIVRNPRPQDRWMLWRYAQHLFHSYAELCTARGDTAAALAYADECLALAEASNSPKNIVKARRSRGNVFLIRGEFALAEVEFERSLELARRLGNPPQVWRTLAAVGDLEAAQGSSDRALGAYDEALTVIDDVATHLEDARLRETFVTSRHILQVWQQADLMASARRR